MRVSLFVVAALCLLSVAAVQGASCHGKKDCPTPEEAEKVVKAAAAVEKAIAAEEELAKVGGEEAVEKAKEEAAKTVQAEETEKAAKAALEVAGPEAAAEVAKQSADKIESTCDVPVESLTQADFTSRVGAGTGQNALIMFVKPDCEHVEAAANAFRCVAKELKGNMLIAKVDVQAFPDMVKYTSQGVPAWKFFTNAEDSWGVEYGITEPRTSAAIIEWTNALSAMSPDALKATYPSAFTDVPSAPSPAEQQLVADAEEKIKEAEAEKKAQEAAEEEEIAEASEENAASQALDDAADTAALSDDTDLEVDDMGGDMGEGDISLDTGDMALVQCSSKQCKKAQKLGLCPVEQPSALSGHAHKKSKKRLRSRIKRRP